METGLVQWIPGDRKWERIYLGASIVISCLAGFFGIFAFLSLAAQLGLIALPVELASSAGTAPYSGYYLGLAVIPAMLDLAFVRRLPERHAGTAPFGVSPRGVAVRLPFRARFVPWIDIRSESETRLVLKLGRATVRIELTPTQSAGVLRALHPPLDSGR